MIRTDVKELKRLIIDLIGVITGSLIVSFGLNMFLIPNQLAAGGATGVAIILLYLFSIPVSLGIILVNVPLFIAGVKFLGSKFGFRTLVGTLSLSFFVEITSFAPQPTDDNFLAALYGGIIVGTGLGIVFRFRGTSGGTAIAAQLLNKFVGLTIGQGMMGVDFFIIATAAYLFDFETALYALIGLFMISWFIDLVQQGITQAKAAFIISDKSKQISREIMRQMSRGVTALDGRGAYTGETREVILVVFNKLELSRLKYLVHNIDPNAFVIVSDANEVLGEGFRKFSYEDI